MTLEGTALESDDKDSGTGEMHEAPVKLLRIR